MAHRLFIAIRPPQAVRDILIDTMEGLAGARWQDDENLHLTLRFVGEVETPAANDLASALGRIEAEGPRLKVAGAGTFERKGRVTALWARVIPTEALEALRQKVERACEQAGLGRETRRFTPHVTLARPRGSEGGIGEWLASHARLAAPEWTATEFVLYQSHLGGQGSRYEPIASYPLAPSVASLPGDAGCR